VTKKILLIDDAIGVGWQKTKKNFWFFVGLILIVWAINLLFSYLQRMINGDNHDWSYWVIFAVELAANILMSVGLIKISIFANDEKKLEYKDLFTHYKYFWRFLGATILRSLIIFIGLILLVVPGIYLSIKFRFVTYLILDKDMGIIEAFKESAKITKGVKWSLLGLEFCSNVIIVLGILALLIGVFAAFPIVMVGRAHAYRVLEGQKS